MPVVVTGADGTLGAAVLAAFQAAFEALAVGGRPLELRATVRDRAAAAPLVAAGVRTAVSDLVDPARFGAVLDGAHTVVHLDDPVGTWDLLLDAAEDTGLRRIVTVLDPADPAPAAAGYELVVLRHPRGRPADEALVAAVLAADRRRVP
jgi:uncharacterized protein YbjT (DUF2867 family)